MKELFHALPKWSIYCDMFKNMVRMMGYWACFQATGCEKWNILYRFFREKVLFTEGKLNDRIFK